VVLLSLGAGALIGVSQQEVSALYVAGAIGLAMVALWIMQKPFIGLCLFLFLLPSEYIGGLSSFTPVKGLGLFLGFAWGLDHLRKRRSIYFPDGFAWWVGFAGWAGISMVWADDKTFAINRYFTLIQLLLALVVAVDLLNSMRRLRLALFSLAGGSAVILGWIVWTYLSSPIATDRLAVPSGLSPNAFVGFGAFVFVLSSATVLDNPRNLLWLFVGLSSMFLSVVPSILAGATASTLLFGSMSVILGILHIWKSRTKFHGVILLAVILAIAGYGGWLALSSDSLRNRIQLAYASPGILGGREQLWLLMLSQWIQAPIWGHGLGGSLIRGFNLVSLSATSGSLNALNYATLDGLAPHNLLLNVLVELGLVGMILFLAALHRPVGFLWGLRQSPVLAQSSLQRIVAYAALGTFVFMFGLSLAEDLLFRKILWMALAIVYATQRVLEISIAQRKVARHGP